MKAVSKWFKSLTPGQQLLVVIIAVIIAWLIYQRVMAMMEATKTSIKNKSEIEVLKEQGKKQSYSNSAYTGWGNELFNAMDGAGTDTETIMRIFSYLHNDIDFIKLNAAFGIRSASDDLFGLIDPSDLRDWLKGDLSEALIKQLNSQLKNQGITKQI